MAILHLQLWRNLGLYKRHAPNQNRKFWQLDNQIEECFEQQDLDECTKKIILINSFKINKAKIIYFELSSGIRDFVDSILTNLQCSI